MSDPLPATAAHATLASEANADCSTIPSSNDAAPDTVDEFTVNAEPHPLLPDNSKASSTPLDRLNNRHPSSTDQNTAPRPKMDFPFDENIFDSAPPQPANDAEEMPYIEAAPEQLIHPPDFKPFFTLVEDPETGAFHHPSVYYIFSDDDPEILTAAILDTFDEAKQDETEPGSPPRRSIIINVAADGKTITSTSSLSREWQALQTSVGPAPSWGNDVNVAERGLMLKISGQQSDGNYEVDGAAHGPKDYPSVEDMLKTFSRRLARLDSTLNRATERM